MSERIKCKDCKWFKKNEYNEKTGYCHIVPPMWQGNGMNCKCFWAAVAIDDFCSKAEPREDVETEFIVAGKIEAGDAVYVIARDELEKMKEEKHQLKVSVQFLVNKMKSFCSYFGKHGLCRKAELTCFETCEFYKSIKKYDCLEGDK